MSPFYIKRLINDIIYLKPGHSYNSIDVRHLEMSRQLVLYNMNKYNFKINDKVTEKGILDLKMSHIMTYTHLPL